MTELRLEAVSRTYPGAIPVEALKEADLTIRQGDFVAIEGPSGAGKSTLLNVLALLDTPTTGCYFIDDVPATGLGDSEAARMRAHTFGFVFQSFHLIPHRSAVENVMLGMAYQGAQVQQAKRQALRALDFVGLSHRSHMPVDRLSGGERQRVAIARAISGGAPVILADEPTGNLDSASSQAVMDLLQDLSRAGTTVVVVTHDPTVAARASRRVTVVDGRVSEEDPVPPPDGRQETVGGRVAPDGDVGAVPVPGEAASRPSTVSWRMMLHDIVRVLDAQPGRSLRLVSVVVVAVVLCLTMVSLAYTARYQVSAAFDAQRNRRVAVGVQEDGLTGVGPAQVAAAPDREGMARVASIAGVEEVMALSTHGDLEATTDPDLAPSTVRAYGLTAATPVSNLLTVVEQAPGTDLSHGLGQGQVLVGAGAAASLGLGPLQASPTLWVEGLPYEVVGLVSQAGLRAEVMSAVVMGQEELSGLSPAREADLEVWVRPGAAQEVGKVVAVAWLPHLAEQTITVAPPDPQGMRQALETDVRNILLTLTVVAVLAGLAALSSAMNTAVQARHGELALRRAIGARKTHLRVLIAGESVLIGLLGGALGAVGSVLVVLGITIVQRWQPVMEPLTLPLGGALGVVTGLVASLLATRRAGRIDPAAALR
ncbi:ABC transporter ATP-binding protein/permease [Actinomyces faecalis]|uniref:ABC transporter ATP-binding protein/permease n=1 Tax=Actinomyces faecalis TaxID=2722820 RepID=UPI0015575F85|nr:ABC transporter ATP-binding protein/permease [Actinomyces faecalis]